LTRARHAEVRVALELLAAGGRRGELINCTDLFATRN
jgi:hypothetical protein